MCFRPLPLIGSPKSEASKVEGFSLFTITHLGHKMETIVKEERCML